MNYHGLLLSIEQSIDRGDSSLEGTLQKYGPDCILEPILYNYAREYTSREKEKDRALDKFTQTFGKTLRTPQIITMGVLGALIGTGIGYATNQDIKKSAEYGALIGAGLELFGGFLSIGLMWRFSNQYLRYAAQENEQYRTETVNHIKRIEKELA